MKKFMNMKKILITGGAGFIGSNLCRKFLGYGINDKIYCLDDFSSGDKNNLNVIENDNLHVINHDIREKIEIYDIDQIYNLASPAAPGHYKKDPLKTIETNIYGTKNILDLATKIDIPILHISTIRVSDPYQLDANSCYTEGKRVAEVLCYEYYRKYKTKVKIARLKSVYGPGMSVIDSRVFPQFIMMSLKNEDLLIKGDGEQLDSFCYISDIISALIKFMNLKEYNTIDPLTLGGDVITIKTLAETIIRINKSHSKIVYENNNKSIGYNMDVLDSEKSNKILKWKPAVNIESGIERISEYYKKQLAHL